MVIKMVKFSNYSSIEIDSRNCIKNSIFICYKEINNYCYINDAINNGATLIISDKQLSIKHNTLVLNNIYPLFKKLLNYFYPYKLKLIGVTGTDGKTSTCLIIRSLINQNDSCGYIGTNGIIYNNTNINSINTTPDIVTIRKQLFAMSKENINYVAMECSSEGILANRLFTLFFDSIIYTNITHEHLNTHKTMTNYINTKLSLIKRLKKNGKIFVNKDDKYLSVIKHKNLITYGINSGDCFAYNIKYDINKTIFTFKLKNNENVVTIPFFGIYNIYNCLASILVLNQFNLLTNINFLDIEKINGRFEMVSNNVIIDFAHTPNALENLLKNIKTITKKKIILVMGSAGNKDKSKRPLLGSVANKYADEIIITSEDPKEELITNIFLDIISTIKKEYYLVLFRKDAIKKGIELLNKNSILVIVGKGVENYEHIYNIKFQHNDFTYTKSLLDT